MADITPRQGKRGTTYELRFEDPATGKYRYKTFKKKGDIDPFLKSLGNIYIPDKESLTIGDALDQWLKVAETGAGENDPVEPETLRHYVIEANHLKNPDLTVVDGTVVAEIKLTKLTAPLCAEIRDSLLLAHSRKNAKRVFSRLRFALNEAVRRGQIGANPAITVKINISSRYKTVVQIPQQDEAANLVASSRLRSMDNNQQFREAWERYNLMFLLLISTGLRPSELRGLPRKSIDPHEPEIHIMQRADELGIIGVNKTEAGRRTLYLTEELWMALLEWLEHIPAHEEALVFPTESGRPESLSNITVRMWYPLQIRAGVVRYIEDPKTHETIADPKYNLYCLRHFFASTEIAMGAEPKELQRAMGHEKIQTTLDLYGHLFEKRTGGGQAARAAQRAKMLAGFEEIAPTAVVVPMRRKA